MGRHFRAVTALALAACLVGPGVSARAAAEPFGRPEVFSVPKQEGCRALDFVGCVEEVEPIFAPTPGAVPEYILRACGGGTSFPTPYYLNNQLDERCRRRCDVAYRSLERALGALGDALGRYNGLARTANQRRRAAGAAAPTWSLPEAAREELDAAWQDVLARTEDAREAEDEYEDCSCPCRSTAGGLGTGTKVAGAAGLAGLTVGILTLAGNGGSGASAPNTPGGPPPSVPPGVVPENPQGFYATAWRTLLDAANSARFIRLQDVPEIRIVLNGPAVSILGLDPFVPLNGTWNENSLQIMASGMGPLAGRPQVGVTLSGTLTRAGALEATVDVGADGSLGPPTNPHTRYGLTATKQRP